MNDFEVFATKPNTYDENKTKCDWLGHHRFRCGHCKKGYFNVKSETVYDDACPSCGYRISLRYAPRK